MADNTQPVGSMSDDMALSRLFELIASGEQDSGELAQLDAIVYERLAQGYDDAKARPLQLVRVG